MNRCDEEEEYRCENGMCIPDQFFLAGDLDCLDWSDEMPLKSAQSWNTESVSGECDEYLCPPTEWSCADGECIPNRLAFPTGRLSPNLTSDSRRDHYFMCETDPRAFQWPMANGRCFGNTDGRRYLECSASNRSAKERCRSLVKCVLSWDGEMGCPCNCAPSCSEKLEEVCPSSLIPDPRESLLAP